MTMKKSEIKILDCTFRDGGYYNAWDFPSDIVQQYIYAMSSVGVDVVELGFRFLTGKGYKGPCGYTTDEYLKSFEIPRSLGVSVMINAADLSDVKSVLALNRLFPNNAKDSPVDIIRIACHLNEVEGVIAHVVNLIDKGYGVIINLMQISETNELQVKNICNQLNVLPVEAICLADSLGSLSPERTIEIVGWFELHTNCDLGIHAHDNMGLALKNTLSACIAGVSWVDSTLTGMGRGAGNVKTEELVIELFNEKKIFNEVIPMFTLIDNYFAPMKRKYQWGTNIYYYLAGKFGIHPTYIQEMLLDQRMSSEDILAAIQQLKLQESKSYNANSLMSAKNFFSKHTSGAWDPSKSIQGRDVLILGSGAGVQHHKKALEVFIRRKKPIVLALNINESVDESLIDYRVACHPVRLLGDLNKIKKSKTKLITPFSMLPETLKKELNGLYIHDFGFEISDRYEFKKIYCKSPSPLVLSYALCVAESGLARTIYMAGFDGYKDGDLRNEEIDQMLSSFIDSSKFRNIVVITPTKIKNLKASSVYYGEL